MRDDPKPDKKGAHRVRAHHTQLLGPAARPAAVPVTLALYRRGHVDEDAVDVGAQRGHGTNAHRGNQRRDQTIFEHRNAASVVTELYRCTAEPPRMGEHPSFHVEHSLIWHRQLGGRKFVAFLVALRFQNPPGGSFL
jgi:hypothetical protein